MKCGWGVGVLFVKSLYGKASMNLEFCRCITPFRGKNELKKNKKPKEIYILKKSWGHETGSGFVICVLCLIWLCAEALDLHPTHSSVFSNFLSKPFRTLQGWAMCLFSAALKVALMLHKWCSLSIHRPEHSESSPEQTHTQNRACRTKPSCSSWWRSFTKRATSKLPLTFPRK